MIFYELTDFNRTFLQFQNLIGIPEKAGYFLREFLNDDLGENTKRRYKIKQSLSIYIWYKIRIGCGPTYKRIREFVSIRSEDRTADN